MLLPSSVRTVFIVTSSTSVASLSVHPRVVCLPRVSHRQEVIEVSAFVRLAPADLDPLRPRPSRVGSKSYVGRWWFASLGRHVGFASLAERHLLMLLDYSGTVREIVRDPCVVLPARGSHAVAQPWLYISRENQPRALLAHGASDDLQELSDVFASTPMAIATIAVHDRSDLSTVEWLSAYRFSRCRLGPDVERMLLDACGEPQALARVIERLPVDAALARVGVYALLWQRRLLLTNGTAPPSNTSLVVAA